MLRGRGLPDPTAALLRADAMKRLTQRAEHPEPFVPPCSYPVAPGISPFTCACLCFLIRVGV